MAKRTWALLLVIVLALVFAMGCDPGSERSESAMITPGESAANGCRTAVTRDSIARLGRNATYDTTSRRSDTATLQPDGPSARIQLATSFLPNTAITDNGVLAARLTALDATKFPHYNLNGNDTVYVWMQRCGEPGTGGGSVKPIHVWYVNPANAATPQYAIGHDGGPHTQRDVMIGSATLLYGEEDLTTFDLDSATIAGFARDSSGSAFAYAITTSPICIRCVAGWCRAT